VKPAQKEIGRFGVSHAMVQQGDQESLCALGIHGSD